MEPGDRFRAGAAHLFSTSTFTDATIICGHKRYEVHRAILASHSKFFLKCFNGEFAEAQSHEVDLSSDNAAAIDLMIGYFYAFEYNDKTADSTWPGALACNAMMYALGDKYDVRDLKALAVKKTWEAASSDINLDDLEGAAYRAYRTTPEADRTLRDLLVDIAIASGLNLHKESNDAQASVRNACRTTPEFACDILARYASFCADTLKTANCCLEGQNVSIQNALHAKCKTCDKPLKVRAWNQLLKSTPR